MINVQNLKNRLEECRNAYNNAVQRMIEADGKMQSRYDTQKEDYAREAEIIELEIIALEEQIGEIENLHTPPDNITVSIGHIVTLQIDGDDPEAYLILEKHSGVPLGEIYTLSIESPIGKAILGKRVGTEVTAIVNQNELPVQIVSLRSAISN